MNTAIGKRKALIGLVAAGALLLGACGGDDGDSSGSPFGGGGGGGNYCDLARSFNENSDLLDGAMGDAGNLRQSMEAARRAANQLEGSAPAEIRSDIALLNNNFSVLVDLLEQFDYNFMAMAMDPEAAARLEAMETAEVEAASRRVNDYTQRTCGFSLDDDTDLSGVGPDDDGVGGIGDVDMSFLIPMYENLYGISTEQAECLVERTFGEDPFDADILSACGIDPETFGN
jgi:hypothetical protein